MTCVNPVAGPRKPGSVGTAPYPGLRCASPVADGGTLPDGEHGEVCVRGPNVMRGYWGLPEETAASFFGDWFRTGDLGWRDADGYFYLVDRIKDLIITNGMNVYPRVIEEALYQHPDLAEAAVVAEPHPLHGELPIAYVVAKPGASAGPGGPARLVPRAPGAPRGPAPHPGARGPAQERRRQDPQARAAPAGGVGAGRRPAPGHVSPEEVNGLNMTRPVRFGTAGRDPLYCAALRWPDAVGRGERFEQRQSEQRRASGGPGPRVETRAMQVSVESGEGLERRMTVDLSAEQFEAEVANRLQQVARTARIAGFRPGKVPLKVLRQRFGAKVRSEAFGDLVQSSFAEAVAQQNLRPAGRPAIVPTIDEPASTATPRPSMSCRPSTWAPSPTR